MKIKDRMLDVILFKTDVPNLIRSWFPDYVDDNNVICPFHDDINASLHISPEGKARCHGCGWSAKNLVDLYAQMEEYTYDQARRILYEDVVKAISASKVRKFEVVLRLNDRAINYLVKKRGLNGTVAKKHRLGLDPKTGRLAIPIFDQFGTCVNIRLASWNRKSKFKMINTKGCGEVRLYPENHIVHEKKILLVEGEWDCLVARRFGIPAATWTGGASNFNKDYLWLLQNKVVFILYDNDEAGEKGKWKMIEELRGVAGVVKTLDPLSPEGKDISDWALADPKCMERLRLFVDMFKVNGKRAKKICPTCGLEVKR